MSNLAMAYMNALTRIPSDACPWLPHRFIVVAWGELGCLMPSRLADSLGEAVDARKCMLASGADEVMVYDTVDGVFY